MATTSDARGFPTLEDHTDSILRDHVVPNCGAAYYWRPRSVRDRAATLDETMHMVDIALRNYENSYCVNTEDSSLIWMPYLFQKPKVGDRIHNKNTDEIYTIDNVYINPITKKWEGIIRLNAINPPDKTLASEKIQFISRDNYVRFTAENPKSLETEDATRDGIMIDAPPMRPTIVHALIRKEPGSIDRQPFGPRKQHTRRTIEYLHSNHYPGSSIDMRGQWLDHIVQFDCWSSDNFSADKLADWFETFMKLYRGILRLNGVSEILFFQRQRDAAVTKWRNDVESRALQYFVRTEDVEAVVVKDIVDLDIQIALTGEGTYTYDNERFIAGQAVSGQLTVDQYKALFQNSSGTYMFGDLVINDQSI